MARCREGCTIVLSSWQLQLLPRHPMHQAIGYMLRQWQELTVFASDPAVPIDNNISEREMKRIVLKRKNSLFVGNERGVTRRRSWRASSARVGDTTLTRART